MRLGVGLGGIAGAQGAGGQARVGVGEVPADPYPQGAGPGLELSQAGGIEGRELDGASGWQGRRWGGASGVGVRGVGRRGCDREQEAGGEHTAGGHQSEVDQANIKNRVPTSVACPKLRRDEAEVCH